MPRGINDYDQARLQSNNRYSNLVNGQFIPNIAERNVLLASNRNINQPSDTVTNGLVLYFDAGIGASYPRAGTTWFDLSRNNNHGTLTNSPGYNIGNGGALSFSGGSHINTSFFPSGANFTMAVWGLSSTANVSNRIMGFADSTEGLTGASIIWGFPFSTQVYFVRRDFFFSGDMQGSVPELSTGWHNIVFTNDSVTGSVAYANGNVIATNAATGCVGGLPLKIARDGNGTDAFNGRVGLAQFYNRALTAAEVRQNFNAQRARFGA